MPPIAPAMCCCTASPTRRVASLQAAATRSSSISRSEAATAGLRPGDIILEIDGRTIEGPSNFLRLLGNAEIGSQASLAILRDGRRSTVRVPIEEEQPTRQRRR